MPRIQRAPRGMLGRLSASAAVLLCIACATPPTEESAEQPAAVPPASSATAEAAVRAYVDPATGRLVPRPQAGDAQDPAAAMPERLSRFQADLVEEPLDEGGYRVDLRGRFRSETVARISADGTVQIDCEPAGREPVMEDLPNGDEASR